MLQKSDFTTKPAWTDQWLHMTSRLHNICGSPIGSFVRLNPSWPEKSGFVRPNVKVDEGGLCPKCQSRRIVMLNQVSDTHHCDQIFTFVSNLSVQKHSDLIFREMSHILCTWTI